MERLQNATRIVKVPSVCGGVGVTAGFMGSDRGQVASRDCSKRLNIRATSQRPQTGRT